MRKTLSIICLLAISFASCTLSSAKNNYNGGSVVDSIPLVGRSFYGANDNKYMTGSITKANISAKYPKLSKHINKLSDAEIQLVKEIDQHLIIVVLQDNRPYWISPDSISLKVINRMFGFCGNVTRYQNEIKQGWGTTKLVHTIDHSMSAPGGKIEKVSYNLSNGESIEKLLFYKETEEMSYSDNTSFMNGGFLIAPYHNIVYGKKKNGKYNIFSYELNQDSLSFALYAYLPIDADAMSSLGIREGKWTHYVGAFIYQQGELYGIFPGTTEAKYTSVGESLNANARLCRYTLPMGESGWLDIDTGMEYPDVGK